MFVFAEAYRATSASGLQKSRTNFNFYPVFLHLKKNKETFCHPLSAAPLEKIHTDGKHACHFSQIIAFSLLFARIRHIIDKMTEYRNIQKHEFIYQHIMDELREKVQKLSFLLGI